MLLCDRFCCRHRLKTGENVPSVPRDLLLMSEMVLPRFIITIIQYLRDGYTEPGEDPISHLKEMLHIQINSWKLHHQDIQDVDEFVSSWEQIWRNSITCSLRKSLQWMGAIRMRVQTSDKNITVIHTTPVHQLTSCEVKSCMFVKKYIYQGSLTLNITYLLILTNIWVHDI